MTITGKESDNVHVRTTSAKRIPMSSLRKTSLVAGGLYVLTFVSIPILLLYSGLDDLDYMASSGADTGVLWGAVLEVIVALAGIGSAVVLFPVVKRQNESAALGLVASRVLEAGLIIVGVVSVLSIVTLRQNLAGAAGVDAASLVTAGQSLAAVHDWTFLIGQGLMPGVNGLLLGFVMYRSGLVPRVIPLMGLIGAPLLIAAKIAVILGAFDDFSPWATLPAVPVALWEFSLGVYLVVKGFKPSPITTGMVSADTASARQGVTA